MRLWSRLCALSGPSGFEGRWPRRRRSCSALWRTRSIRGPDGQRAGPCAVRQREGAKRLLLDAHLDEIGFLVTGHEEGFLNFAPLGGVDPRMLPDRELTVLTDPPLAGVVACLPPTCPDPGGHGQVHPHPGALPGCGAEPGGGGAPGAGGHPGGLPRGLLSSGAGADLRQVPG